MWLRSIFGGSRSLSPRTAAKQVRHRAHRCRVGNILFLEPFETRCLPTVHALFNLETPQTGPFPSNQFSVADRSNLTGLRVDLPLPDPIADPSDNQATQVINTLDGFDLQPRLSVPFDGPIDVSFVNSQDVFLINLGDTVDRREHGDHIVGLNQIVWDPPSNTLHVESDQLLDQHTEYALVVTNGLRDTHGRPVQASEAFRDFRHQVRGDYKHELLEAIHAAREVGVREGDIVTASVFTTESVTAVLEKIRDQIHAAPPPAADFNLGPDGERTVFNRTDVTAIHWEQQTGENPPSFTPIEVNLSLLDIIPGSVGQIAFGRYVSPDYEVHPGEFIPPVATRTGTPVVQSTNDIYLNLFLPSSPEPPGGWPVGILGIGANGSKQRDLWVVATMAEQGIATIIINTVGRGFGPLGTLTVHQTGGPSVTFPAGGRGIDQTGSGTIGPQEGQNATGSNQIIGTRDCNRQTVVDLMQMVRAIQGGMDVDGDGDADLDPSHISYLGWSLGANIGTDLLAIEPDVHAGALYSVGGPIFENSRLSPVNRSSGFGPSLESQMPSLINRPGITTLAGVVLPPPTGPFFNENVPLRDGIPLTVGLADGTTSTIQSPVINTVPGANAIQEYLEKRDWVNQSGNQVAYAPYLRKHPLPGIDAKSILILFGKGDEQVPNPNATALLRAGDLRDRATFFRNDLAFAEDSALPKDPHPFVNNIDSLDSLVAAIARGAQEQIATFLGSGGTQIIHPEPADLFETPIQGPLPEDLNFIPTSAPVGGLRQTPGSQTRAARLPAPAPGSPTISELFAAAQLGGIAVGQDATLLPSQLLLEKSLDPGPRGDREPSRVDQGSLRASAATRTSKLLDRVFSDLDDSLLPDPLADYPTMARIG